ncbi:MAG: hypothetical protein NC200_00590 [Candidatus Gastranaerophilales bacterium]|nr:hypothetical protein [Candidatus Gastranaerophilales bacterium]
MVSIQISKGQGLTQALKSYAESKGYDTSKITKENWMDTIGNLEKIQSDHKENEQNSIYTDVKTSKPYGNMLVHEGNVEFSEGEIQTLFASMGLETKGSAFNKWTVSVSKNPEAEYNNFRVANNFPENPDVGDFVELTRSYIKEYDQDGDGAINFDELYAKEVQLAKDNNADIPTEDTVRTLFDRLNISNENESKDKLMEKEIFNYFYAMDNLNIKNLNDDAGEFKSDGVITKAEYMTMALSLADTSTEEKSNGSYIAKFLKDTYNKLFN